MLFMVVCVFLIALVADVLIKLARSYSSPIPRVLYLREITSPPSTMNIAAENPFIAEFVLLFENLVALDYAVMKYVGEEVRILSRQEGKHAKLHQAAAQQRKKGGETTKRWNWLVWLMQNEMKEVNNYLLKEVMEKIPTPKQRPQSTPTISQILFCIIPLPENQTLFRLVYQFFNTELKTRGITFDIVEQETYKLY